MSACACKHVPCDQDRCRFEQDGKRCKAPRLFQREGCTKHAKLLGVVEESIDDC